MDFQNLIMDARSLYTLLSFFVFVGIMLWAYSGRRKTDFETAANLPFADEADTDAEVRHV